MLPKTDKNQDEVFFGFDMFKYHTYLSYSVVDQSEEHTT